MIEGLVLYVALVVATTYGIRKIKGKRGASRAIIPMIGMIIAAALAIRLGVYTYAQTETLTPMPENNTQAQQIAGQVSTTAWTGFQLTVIALLIAIIGTIISLFVIYFGGRE